MIGLCEHHSLDRPIGKNQAIQHPLAANWMAHSGFGYARAPRQGLPADPSSAASPRLILCFIAERVLGLPKSYPGEPRRNISA